MQKWGRGKEQMGRERDNRRKFKHAQKHCLLSYLSEVIQITILTWISLDYRQWTCIYPAEQMGSAVPFLWGILLWCCLALDILVLIRSICISVLQSFSLKIWLEIWKPLGPFTCWDRKINPRAIRGSEVPIYGAFPKAMYCEGCTLFSELAFIHTRTLLAPE